MHQFAANFLSRASSYLAPFSPRVFEGAAERDAIFSFHGLYGSRHLWGHDYLISLADFEIAMLVAAFDMQMAKLDAEERAFVLDHSARVYSGYIDDLIQSLAVEARRKEVDASGERVKARAHAIETDRARILSAQKSLENAISRTDVRIARLEAEIERVKSDTIVTGIEKELVEADVLGKELEAARAELELQRSQLRALQIQQDIVEIGLEVSKTHVRVAELGADKVQWQVRIAENQATIAELSAEITKLQTAHAQVEAREVNLHAEQVEQQFGESEVATRVTELQAERDRLISEISMIEARTKAIESRTLTTSVQEQQVGVEVAQIAADTEQIKASTARADVEIARAAITQTELSIAEVEKDIVQHKAEHYWPARTTAAVAKAKAYSELGEKYGDLESVEEALQSDLMAILEARLSSQQKSIGHDYLLYKIQADGEIALNKVYLQDAIANAGVEISAAREDVKMIMAQKNSSKKSADGAIMAARRMGEAVITSKLTHAISGA